MFSFLLQIYTFKLDLFGTFSKIGVENPKIIKFQNNTEIALVDGF